MPGQSDKSTTLQTLLQQAAQGDELAWRDIVQQFTPRVYGLIRAHCGDGELAEEITQSTFCTIAAKIGQYTEAGRFEPWLFRIAMNRLRDEMRRRKRQARPVESQALIGLAGAEEMPQAEDSIDETTRRSLQDALTRLSEEDQRIIHLRHFGGLSFRQIAELLDQPLGTVLARQHRALKKLKDFIGTPPGDEYI